MMCANYDSLKEEIIKLEMAGVDVFHVDIMDGRFVPNFGMGVQDVECIRRNTKKCMDIHLMVEDPGNYVDLFLELGADIIYIHPESDRHPTRTLEKIKDANKSTGIAINPGTSLSSIEELLPLLDYIMVMTVNPGFAGQKYLDFTNKKIERLNKLKNEYSFKIMVDGAISTEKVTMLSKIGVDGFILGTSTLFGKKESYKTIFKRLKDS